MGSTALRLLCFTVSFASLAVAQATLPIPAPNKTEKQGIGAYSPVVAARAVRSATSSRGKIGQGGAGQNAAGQASYRSAIAPDASPASGFAGFYAAPFYSTVASPYESGAIAVLTGDFNDDGKPDLLTFTFLGGIGVLLNDGTGVFGNPILSQIGTMPGSAPGALVNYSAVYAVDLNGDGYTDLVIPTSNYEVAVLLNHQDGTFPTTTYLPLQNLNSSSATAADGSVAYGKTTANGGVDLVSVQSFTPSTAGAQTTILVETLLNDGTGNFPTQKSSNYTAPAPSFLQTNPIATLVDVNQDGKLDLLVARNANGSASNGPLYVDVLLGNGDGTFQPPGANGSILIAGTNGALFGNNLLTANLTAGSSIPDILVGTYSGVYEAKGNGDGTFQAATQILDYLLPTVRIGDLNGDGKLDMMLDSTGGVTAFLGNGDGTFGGIAGTAVSGYPGSGSVQQMVVADFNGDGKADFAAVNDENSNVEVGIGNGDGSFHAAPVLYSASSPVLNPQQIYFQVSGDILGNGTRQLIGAGDGEVLSASPNGTGGFNYVAALPSVPNFTYAPYPVTGDFNGDGKQDIILSGQTYNIAVALSNGDGTFATPVEVPLSVTLSCVILGVAVGDVNGDGKLDLVATYIGDSDCGHPVTVPSGYLVALGNGDGTFKTATFTASGETLIAVALAAYHGPGKPLDMVTSDEGIPPGSTSVVNPNVSFLPGNGDGTFGMPVIVFNGSLSTIDQLLTDDYNQDGKPDLTFFDGSEIDSTSGALLYAGNGDGMFAAPVVVSSIGGAFEGTYGDINNDGVPDLIFSGYEGLSVALGTGGGSFAPLINYFAPPLGGPILAGKFLGDNAQSIVASRGEAAGTAFYMNQGGTLLTVVPNSTTVTSGQNLVLNVPLQATVQDQPAPTGSITLYDGTTQLSSGPVSGFSFSTAQLSVGTHSITAAYGGDSHFYANTSAAVSITVATVSPDFTITATPGTVTVSPGGSGNITLAVAANPALTGNVTFQCGGLPTGAACVFNPATLAVTPGQSSNVTLNVTTQSATSAQNTQPDRQQRIPYLGDFSIAVVLLFFIPAASKRKLFSVLALLCAVGSPFLGCGGGGPGNSSPANPGTPAGTTTVTVTANAIVGTTAITHTSKFTLVVQ